MDAVYAMLIANKLKTIDDVPAVFRSKTIKALAAMGLDENGMPLQ